ncbi:MAG: hypothetical protein PHS79_00510 [Patescibacteria group bacterium]|nr:hypothetical protein [Patescibacteria group bacterium]
MKNPAEELYRTLSATVKEVVGVSATVRRKPFNAFAPQKPLDDDVDDNERPALLIMVVYSLNREQLEIAQNANRAHVPVFLMCRDTDYALCNFLRREPTCTKLIAFRDTPHAAEQLGEALQYFYGLHDSAEVSPQL